MLDDFWDRFKRLGGEFLLVATLRTHKISAAFGAFLGAFRHKPSSALGAKLHWHGPHKILTCFVTSESFKPFLTLMGFTLLPTDASIVTVFQFS